MIDNKWEVAQAILNEYFNALRGDWSPETIDGRGERQAWWNFRAAIDSDITDKQILRRYLGICAKGGGHWEIYCDSEHCPSED